MIIQYNAMINLFIEKFFHQVFHAVSQKDFNKCV